MGKGEATCNGMCGRKELSGCQEVTERSLAPDREARSMSCQRT